MSAKNIQVDLIRRLPALVIIYPDGKGASEGMKSAVRDLLGTDLPRLRVVVSAPKSASAADIACAVRAAGGVKANPRKPAIAKRPTVARRKVKRNPFTGADGPEEIAWRRAAREDTEPTAVTPARAAQIMVAEWALSGGKFSADNFPRVMTKGEFNYVMNLWPNKTMLFHERLAMLAKRNKSRTKTVNPGRPTARRNPHPSMTEQQASDTIAALGGMGKLRAMVGADNFIRGYETDGTPALSFKFKGSKTANYARIALDPSDTYTLRLFKIRGYEAKPVYEASDLYAENLRPAFERATGLHLSLGTMKGNPKKGAAKRPAARKAAKRNPREWRPVQPGVAAAAGWPAVIPWKERHRSMSYNYKIRGDGHIGSTFQSDGSQTYMGDNGLTYILVDR